MQVGVVAVGIQDDVSELWPAGRNAPTVTRPLVDLLADPGHSPLWNLADAEELQGLAAAVNGPGVAFMQRFTKPDELERELRRSGWGITETKIRMLALLLAVQGRALEAVQALENYLVEARPSLPDLVVRSVESVRDHIQTKYT